MCGINTIINNNGIDLLVDRYHSIMVNATRHRGTPEGFNEKLTLDRCILGVNRLPITSDESEKQPASNEDGTISAVLNGEIYNYKTLRADLQAKGHSFKGGNDTEVLVHAYKQYGNGLLSKLDGMFAFVIYDSQNNEYLIGRDPFGIKPLYYSESDGILYVSSEIKGLASLDISQIDYLKPGHYLTRKGEFSYFSLNPDNHRETGIDVLIKGIRKRFDEAVRKMVDTSLPICVYFSGGIDSAAVLATARKYHQNVTAITFGLNRGLDRIIAERYCQESNIPLIIEEAPEIKQLAPKFVEIAETFEPNIVRHMVGNYTVSKVAHDNGFRIALVGEASDEIFCGYGVFKEVENDLVTRVSKILLSDLHRTQLQRVDRAAMHWTVETRVPFLDVDLVNFALGLPNEYKVRQTEKGPIDKWIFRMAMTDRLPSYITDRAKLPFCTGAGLNTDSPSGTFHEISEEAISDSILEKYKRLYPEYNLSTKEEVMNFIIFEKDGFTKATFNKDRIGTARDETRKRVLGPDAPLPKLWNTFGN